MKEKPLWVIAGIGLCILAEGADARTLEEIVETRDHVLSNHIPSVSEVLKQLTLQADNQRQSVNLSLREDEMSTNYGLASLSDEEVQVLVDLYAFERKITFLSDSVVVHPHQRIEEQLKAQFSGGGGFYLKLGAPRKKSLETAKK